VIHFACLISNQDPRSGEASRGCGRGNRHTRQLTLTPPSLPIPTLFRNKSFYNFWSGDILKDIQLTRLIRTKQPLKFTVHKVFVNIWGNVSKDSYSKICKYLGKSRLRNNRFTFVRLENVAKPSV